MHLVGFLGLQRIDASIEDIERRIDIMVFGPQADRFEQEDGRRDDA